MGRVYEKPRKNKVDIETAKRRQLAKRRGRGERVKVVVVDSSTRITPYNGRIEVIKDRNGWNESSSADGGIDYSVG
jgi:hypothetical protein